MSDPIGPGDWVEHFTDQFRLGVFRPSSIPVGAVVQVDAVLPGSMFSDGFGALEIVGCYLIEPDGWRECFDIRNFRPVHRPGKSTLIQDLLKKAKEPIKAQDVARSDQQTADAEPGMRT